VGEGTNTTLSLCEGTFIDTIVTVFTGSCDSLTCVGENDDSCGFSSVVEWYAEEGETYFALVRNRRSSDAILCTSSLGNHSFLKL
jgi:hypothetical protein